jgi:hypothetical protein
MTAPDASDIREWTRVDLGPLGYGEDPALQVVVDRAVELVESMTGQTFAGMPAEYEDLARQVVQALVERWVFQAQEEYIETAADFSLISSFSAGPYSETRRGLGELKASGLIFPDPGIHGLLWAMLTDDKRDDWLAWLSGVNAPAFEVTEVDWQAPTNYGWYSSWQTWGR